MAAPDVARRYAADVAAEKAAALASVALSWRRLGDDFDAGWALVGPRVVEAVTGAQSEVAALADRYVTDVAPLTVARLRGAEYEPNLSAWVGVAGDGRPVESLAAGAVIQAKQQVAGGATAFEARQAAGQWLIAAMGTVLSDTHRGVEQVGINARRVGMYTRMLTGPSNCGRCVILAGRRYKAAQAFLRHPRCDCVHIPASENLAGDLTTDPHAYLDSLSDEELARVLGSRANAQAWRDGADVNQLVNAYRRKGAVQTAQVRGRRLTFTTTGGTRQQPTRLMPSSIYELAANRAHALRLLRIHGWVRF